jgi:hypothetical protein
LLLLFPVSLFLITPKRGSKHKILLSRIFIPKIEVLFFYTLFLIFSQASISIKTVFSFFGRQSIVITGVFWQLLSKFYRLKYVHLHFFMLTIALSALK